MPEPQQQSFQRQIAYKVRVSDILNSGLNKEDMSLHIKVNNSNVSRVNIIATLVYKTEDNSNASAMIDDGSGRISLRSFERQDIFSKVSVGDVVIVIGKIREYNNEKYIIPEIVKKNERWADVRKMELKINAANAELKPEEQVLVESGAGATDEIFSLIRKLDSGEGVLIDDVIKDCKNESAEKILSKMLENGDIFEVKPGKIKILE